MSDVVIHFAGVSKNFAAKGGITEAVRDVNLPIARNEFVCVVGPSGCGKTTLLQLCAGLARPTAGRVVYKGREITGINTDAGYITQESNLYPWRSLIENVEFSLEMRGMAKAERRREAQQFIDLMGLAGFEEHYPYQLSGGMQKRASIARTMVYDPDVVLMDEPFGALDAQTRMILQAELLKVWSLKAKTILFITHDIVEAIALADRVVLMTRRPGTIKDVFRVDLPRPRNVFEIHGQPGFAEMYRRIWEHFKVEMKVE
ncbi:MAG: ABC transporter ATP-binding protein [Candidatus Rokubacteria bacterium]|nr:ABC transporter ATP-binding protein [Candidatus Rokubacteria bacterium]MBI4255406.1 ABC transporter ATP-binding protein [Candidatus Rokubacteria bacterium]MBI4628648.1 ABC transporter ATP-binding protein [Candidatus Rokubacteria bacterium]